MTPAYLGNFKTREDVAEEFHVTLPDDLTILFAAYEYYSYEGQAFVLFEQGGKLYEVEGSHCSCYGLSDLWVPEEAVIAELRTRRFGWVLDEAGRNQLMTLLDEYEVAHEGRTAPARA